MVCKRYERLLVDYLAGELSQAEQEAVKGHLKECSKCAGLFEEYRNLLEKSRQIDISVPEWQVWEKKLSEIKAVHPYRIRLLKPAVAMVSLLLLISVFFVRMTDNEKGKVARTGKNGYGIVLTKLPYPEKTILENIEYIDEESASKLLDVVLDTPVFTIDEN